MAKQYKPGYHPGYKNDDQKNDLKKQGFYKWPAWRRLRLLALQRDHYQCQLRLSKKCTHIATEVHHIKPIADYPGYLQTIITEIENLGGSTEGMSADAATFVAEFNASFAETQTAKDEFAKTVPGIETDFTDAIASIEQAATEADFSGLNEALESAFANVGVDFQSIGKGAADGLSGGIEANIGPVKQAGENAGQAVIDATMNALDEHSPSRVMEEIGENADEGLAEGIEGNRDRVSTAAQDVGDEITEVLTDSAKESVESYLEEFGKISAQTQTKLTELKTTVNDSMLSLSDNMISIGQETMIGATVGFTFDEKWDALDKIVVFRAGKVARDVIGVTDWTAVEVPCEVLRTPGYYLKSTSK